MRLRPQTGVVLRDRSLRLELGDLPVERGRDLLPRDHSRTLGPIAGDVLRPPLDRLDERAAFTRILRRYTNLAERLVEQERRRNESDAACGSDPLGFAIELLRVRLHAREVRLGI